MSRKNKKEKKIFINNKSKIFSVITQMEDNTKCLFLSSNNRKKTSVSSIKFPYSKYCDFIKFIFANVNLLISSSNCLLFASSLIFSLFNFSSSLRYCSLVSNSFFVLFKLLSNLSKLDHLLSI